MSVKVWKIWVQRCLIASEFGFGLLDRCACLICDRFNSNFTTLRVRRLAIFVTEAKNTKVVYKNIGCCVIRLCDREMNIITGSLV